MNAHTTIELPSLAKLREPFPDHHISKLPKPTKAQTQAVKDDFKKGVRCKLCGSWHHPDVVHLDYVGHAAMTDRLLDTDPEWTWEPLAFRDGLPAFDQTGGLWIKLTVCGVTRLGYGHAAVKQGVDPGAREKEVIGDALRNAAMRFGAALDLWHKGDLHAAEQDGEGDKPAQSKAEVAGGRAESKSAALELPGMPDDAWAKLVQLIEATKANTGAMLKHFKVADLRMLSPSQYDEAVGKLENDLAAMAKDGSNRAAQTGAAVEVDDTDIPY